MTTLPPSSARARNRVGAVLGVIVLMLIGSAFFRMPGEREIILGGPPEALGSLAFDGRAPRRNVLTSGMGIAYLKKGDYEVTWRHAGRDFSAKIRIGEGEPYLSLHAKRPWLAADGLDVLRPAQPR